MITCFSDDYVLSQNSALEFRFAHISLKLPIFKAIVGTGNEWRKNELAFLAGNYPEYNFQYENQEAHNLLLASVQATLEEINKSSVQETKKTDEEAEEKTIDNSSSAFQELYELTQRKFLAQLVKICKNSDSSTSKNSYQRLFCIDLIEKHKIDALKEIRKKKNDQSKESEKSNETEAPEATKDENGKVAVEEEMTEIPKKDIEPENKSMNRFKMAKLKLKVISFTYK